MHPVALALMDVLHAAASGYTERPDTWCGLNKGTLVRQWYEVTCPDCAQAGLKSRALVQSDRDHLEQVIVAAG